MRHQAESGERRLPARVSASVTHVPGFLCYLSSRLLTPSFLTLPWRGLKEGALSYTRGDYAIAYRELLPLAGHGDPQAQLFLGHMYDTGKGIPGRLVATV
jgi:hypothetical protein